MLSSFGHNVRLGRNASAHLMSSYGVLAHSTRQKGHDLHIPSGVLFLPFLCVALGGLLNFFDPQASSVYTTHSGSSQRSVLPWMVMCVRLLVVGVPSINHGNKCTFPSSQGPIGTRHSIKSIGLISNNNPLKGALVTQRISATLITNYSLNC